MADFERRHGGGGGGGYNNPRKRRFQEDEEPDRDRGDRHRGPRRRFDGPPPHIRIRKQLIALAENPILRWHEEVGSIATLFNDNYNDEILRGNFVDLIHQLAVEQPLKTPFLAAVVLVTNTNKPEVVDALLAKVARMTEGMIKEGDWRGVKLNLKLLACLHSCLSGDGLFPLLEELFSRAVDLQTASSDDTIGTELVKIILLTIPYIMAAAPGQWVQRAAELMDKTDIIASEPHALQALIDPYHPEDKDSPTATQSLIGLLQKQLQSEAASGWPLSCLPRPWTFPVEEIEQQAKLDDPPKHDLPSISVPETVVTGARSLFPEVYFSVYGTQDIPTVPSVTNVAASLVRDGLLDTINALDFNRNVTARFLTDVDCYFAPGTFVKRATPFDKLREMSEAEPGRPTWKPEDVAVDAVFSQLFLLPAPEHKLVYYHAVLTEACKLAPAAIAPSLGRAIRFLYRNAPLMDLELANRFLDWFSHHLSNFGFTWKWVEWVDDVQLPDADAHKAFILGAIDKEIRLSFAQRIKNTLPEPYKPLIGAEMEKDAPDFKFNNNDTPFAAEGREIAALLKRKAPEEDMQPVVDRIHGLAVDMSLDPLVASTDVFVTAVLWIGSKSLSHVLAAIERTKDRLLDAGSASGSARAQIISAVADYWAAHPGVAVAIVEKLLNYSILSPESVVQWVLVNRAGTSRGDALSWAWSYEMVANTVAKVTRRVRQVATAGGGEAGPEGDETREREAEAMRTLFRSMDDALVAWASGSKDEMIEATDGEGEHDRLVRRWGERWLRVFRRKAAIEEAFLLEAARGREAAAAKRQEELVRLAQNGGSNGQQNGSAAAGGGGASADEDVAMGNGASSSSSVAAEVVHGIE